MEIYKDKRIFLLIILFISFFLRVYGLSDESIWIDEAYSIKYAKLDVSQIFFIKDRTPPLYYTFLHLWITLFGNSEFSIRFPSVIFGLLSILMIYKIGKKIFNEETGLLSSLLLGLSVLNIQYSQEARTYSLSVLLTLLSMYCFIELLKKGGRRYLTGYILFSILLIYSHIWGFFIIIAQNLYFLTLFFLSKKDCQINMTKWISIQGILLLLFAPWARILLSQIRYVHHINWISIPTRDTVVEMFRIHAGSYYVLLLFLILSFFSFATINKIDGNVNQNDFFSSVESCRWNISFSNVSKFYFLLVWLMTPIILPFIISRLSRVDLSSRYTIIASISFYLIVGKGISNMHKRLKPFIISIIIILLLTNSWVYFNSVRKDPWKIAVQYVDTNARNDDLLLFNPPSRKDLMFDYYSKRDDLIKKRFPLEERNVDEINIKELMPTVDGYKRVWVVIEYSNTSDKNGLITSTLNKYYELSYYKEYRDIRVYLFNK